MALLINSNCTVWKFLEFNPILNNSLHKDKKLMSLKLEFFLRERFNILFRSI